MNYKDLFKTANANLLRSKLRTFLTLSAIFIGALTLMLTIGVGYGLRAYVDDQVGSVGAEDAMIIMAASETENPLSSDVKEYDPDKAASTTTLGFTMLSSDDLKTIESYDEIFEVTPQFDTTPLYVTAGGKKYQARLAQGVDGLKQPLRAGRTVNQSTDKFEVTIPPGYVKAFGYANDEAAVGKTLSFTFTNAQGAQFMQKAVIVGVQKTTIINANAMTTNTSFARATYEQATDGLPKHQREQYSAFTAKFDTSISDEALKSLQTDLQKKGYRAFTLEDQLGVIKNVINGLILSLNIFAAIALIAASFGIVNTLLMAVQERTREIGLMKALGMRRRRIFQLFSLEAVMLGFWGSAIALLAANGIGRIANKVASDTILKDFDGLELLSFPWLPMLGIVVLIMAISWLASVLPARRASRLDPIEALRYE